MTIHSLCGKLLAASLALAVCAQSGAAAPAAFSPLAASSNPDATLYTNYSLYQNQTLIDFVLCGSLPDTEGCYGSGQFTGFGRVGAILEGSRVVVAGTGQVWRNVYVLDMSDGGGTSTKTALYVYRITVTVENTSDATVTSSLIKKLSLPLVGGASAKAYMAANGNHVFVGTSKSTSAVMVAKSNNAMSTYTGSTPTEDVSSITADASGFVTTQFGGNAGSYVVANSTGSQVQSQAGSSFQLGTGLGLSALDVDLSTTSPLPAPIVHYTHAVAPASLAGTDAAPDAGLYRNWSFGTGYKTANYAICGSLSGSNGCYATGTLGNFGRVGAMVEGPATSNTTKGTVTRNIYVLDQAVGGGSSTAVALYVYKMVETVAAPNVSVTTSLVKTVGLSLIGGGSSVRSYIATNGAYIYTGTDQSTFGESISRTTYATSGLGGFSPPENVSSITPDQYGYLALTFGGVSGVGGFYEFAPNGESEGDGGGSDFMVGNVQGVTTADMQGSGTSAAAAKRLQVHYHAKAH